MKLLIPILLNCLIVLAVYLIDKYTAFKKIKYMPKQIIIGILFGGVSAFASSFGVEWLGTVVNVRDAAPLSAGLIFGSPAGIISGIVGGLYRWFSVYWGAGVYTQLACSIATVLAGFMAAGLRKLMFDNKKPTSGYGICISVVCEVIHMILVFITNMDNSSYAFEFVKGAAVPMILGNALAIGLSIGTISFLSREVFERKLQKVRIANTFQRWLLVCIVLAYIITSSFTFILQNGMVKIEIREQFTSAINDVEKDVRGKSNAKILSITEKVKQEYENSENASLKSISEKYNIIEVNVIDSNGIIIDSTESKLINNFDMNSKEQSKEFVEVLKTQDSFVQEYGPRGEDESVWRKYAAVNLTAGGFIQVGFNDEQFYAMLDEFVIDVTKNRHVGKSGFVAVCNNRLCMVIDNEYSGKHISSIGINPPEEMQAGKTSDKLFYADVVDNNSNFKEKYIYVFKIVEGYCIIASMPETEAMFMRDASIYMSIFMQVLIFATLFVFIYILIKRVIINNLRRVNDTLGRITEGDLNVIVDVRSNEEFSSLSDDINSTVSTLKRYISEAAARIDKELEYAKQIQLSALPTNFPTGEDFCVYAQMIAAKEVGGDFYDFYKINDNTVAFLVADVSGKGIPAALFMMTAKAIIKELAERGLPVNEIFTKANEKLCENNESGMFVTAWMGILDINTGKVQFANAGHNPPLIKSTDGTFKYLKTRPGFVLAGMQGVTYRIGEILLSPGDRLFLYTDGVPEATNSENKLYGEDRLLDFINQNVNAKPIVLLSALKSDIDLFVGDAPQFDDITMLMFDYKIQKEGEYMTRKTFDAKIDELSDVICFVEKTLEEYKCPMKIQTSICVAIEEIFVNVSRYAYGEEEGTATLSINFDKDKKSFTFCMTDKGIPFDPLKRTDPDITLSAEERDIGGLGIFITKKIMDNVTYSYENNENILTMTKTIKEIDNNDNKN